MRRNTEDKTLYRNYVRKWKFLIHEYELVKRKRHPKFRFVSDFYRFHQTHRQTFLKYYHRFQQRGTEEALVPQKRGPKWRSPGLLSDRSCSTGRRASIAMRFANCWRPPCSTGRPRRVRSIG